LCQIRQQSLSSVIDQITNSLDPSNPEGVAHGRPLNVIQMHHALANVYAYEGEMEKSLLEWLAAMGNRSRSEVLHVGQPVPEFSFTDQDGQHISLSQFKGRVVALSFVYTRCPRPEYCVRLANNFGLLQRRFQRQEAKTSYF
jgi:cytochrome oxidase Cu insertion factor (SCO1/SenC/PrrC family)